MAHPDSDGHDAFAGQFLLLFFAYTQGVPPGVASVVMQSQVFFTVLIAAATLGDAPTLRQAAAMGVAFVGLDAGMILIIAGLAVNVLPISGVRLETSRKRQF